MAFIYENGIRQDVTAQVTPSCYKEAQDKNITVAQLFNQKFPQADVAYGTAAEQILASEGLTVRGKNQFGLRDLTIAEILDGKGYQAASTGGNAADHSSLVGGTAASTLFPVAVETLVEAAVAKDLTTDTNVWAGMIANRLSVSGSALIQPVIDYNTKGGPMQAAAQRVAEFTEPPSVLRFGTSQRVYTIPTFGILLEFSNQALRSTTLDMLGLTLARFLAIEKDSRVYSYLSSIFAGDSDLNSGAVSAVTTTSLDSGATGGAVTHKSWVKFLARSRKYRKITHVVGDIAAYLAVEGRSGRPGSTAYDPTLSRIDPQAVAQNVGFGNDVKWFIVDDATNGGPVPANTVWALDASRAITLVENVSANYSASEQFALRQSQALVLTWGEAVYRLYGNTDLTPFDVLTIS